MELTSIIGLGAILILTAIGLATGGLPAVFINWHGIGIVIGGTFCALMINTPMDILLRTGASLTDLFSADPYIDRLGIMDAVMSLAQDIQSRGMSAFQNVNKAVASGYLAYAAQIAVEYNNPEILRQVLENEIIQNSDLQNEAVNVFRTAGILAPMFGLLGTLIGIVEVLRQIANPAQVGSAMAVAITTAFYGIAMANVFCVPIAGKLRIRYWRETQAKSMILEGVYEILQRTPAVIISRKLKSYL